MALVKLKSLFGNRKETGVIITQIAETLKLPFAVIDADGKLLTGQALKNPDQKIPLEIEGQLLGWVEGAVGIAPMAALIQHLLNKESEKKTLGREVLNLYREINLIYNFSEKLAAAIEPAIIARLALEEASQLIQATDGAVFLLNEKTGTLERANVLGSIFSSETGMSLGSKIFWQLDQKPNAEIVNRPDKDPRFSNGIPAIGSLIFAPLKMDQRVQGAIVLSHTSGINYTAGELKLLNTLALQAASAIESALLYEKTIQAAKEREETLQQINEATSKFVPSEFLRALGREQIIDVRLGDQAEREVTVLFVDIRDYTSFSEQMTPEENFRFINAFNSRLGPVIRENGGFINQYLGDAIMALFPDAAEGALCAAIQVQRAVQKYNEVLHPMHIRVGIGMHTGPLIMGITGDQKRMDAATISDTVNTASRIESLTKYYQSSIILSEETLIQIPNFQNRFHLRDLGKVQVKGKLAPISIFECYDGDSQGMIRQKEATLANFSEGLNYYFNRSFSKAVDAFQQVIELHPEDPAAQRFLQKANSLLQTEVPEDWTGVERMAFK